MFQQRLISALRLGIPALLAFIVPGWLGGVLFLVLCAVAIIVMVNEFFTLAESFSGTGFRRFTAAYAFIWVVAIAVPQVFTLPENCHLISADVAGILGFLFLASVRALLSKRPFQDKMSRVFLSLACLLYLIWPLSFIPRLFFISGVEYSGRFLALFAMVVTKGTDAGAYVVGTLTSRLPQGNQKIIPDISPSKSWEGFLGGIVAGALVAVGAFYLLEDHLVLNGVPAMTPVMAAVFGAFAGVLGFVGDAVESMLKRASHAKDSGDIPGLGGLLDVMDSMIFVLPTAYVLFRVVSGQ